MSSKLSSDTSHRPAGLGAVVLCGGRSSRMGAPKHLLPFGETTMLDQVCRTLCESAGPVVVVAAVGQDVGPLPPQTEVARDTAPHLGPLAGLREGLRHLKRRSEIVFASGCDTPLLNPAFVHALAGRLGSHDLAICRTGKFLNPLAAVYRVSVLEAVEQLIAEERMRPAFLTEVCNAVIVDADELRDVDPHLDSLRNANRPEEYEALLRDVGTHD